MTNAFHKLSSYRMVRVRHEWVRDRLLELQKYQKDLAAAMGVSNPCMSQWTHGMRRFTPTRQQLAAMAAFLEMPVDECQRAIEDHSK